MSSFPQTCPLFEGLKYMSRRGFIIYSKYPSFQPAVLQTIKKSPWLMREEDSAVCYNYGLLTCGAVLLTVLSLIPVC